MNNSLNLLSIKLIYIFVDYLIHMNKILKYILLIFIFLSASLSYYFYQAFFSVNINHDIEKATFLIKTGSNFKDVRDNLIKDKVVNEVITFSFVSKVMKYQENVKPGKYTITGDMTNIDLVRMLRNGAQEPVNVIFNNKRLKEDLAIQVSEKLECKAKDIIALMNDNEYLKQFGFDSLTVPAMFIPNTYQFYWNTSADQLMQKMKKEYDKYWTEERRVKASKLNLTPIEISTLASIVEEEQKRLTKERPAIAGVYLNRLKIGQALQADPTIKYALGDFTIKRVTNLSVESPYNTYKYAGLPPGPICIPSINALESVLNYEDHDYFFFCARPDGSGYHDFSKTFAGHKLKAIKYRRQQTRNGNL